MIDLAAITPFFQNIFFGLRKAQQVGGQSAVAALATFVSF
jgi:hypothetical protein